MTTTYDDSSLLFRAHQRQLIRKGAFPGNLGWVVTETAYVSKTDKGILTTKCLPQGGYYHEWAMRDDNGDWQPIDNLPDVWKDWRDDPRMRHVLDYRPRTKNNKYGKLTIKQSADIARAFRKVFIIGERTTVLPGHEWEVETLKNFLPDGWTFLAYAPPYKGNASLGDVAAYFQYYARKGQPERYIVGFRHPGTQAVQYLRAITSDSLVLTDNRNEALAIVSSEYATVRKLADPSLTIETEIAP